MNLYDRIVEAVIMVAVLAEAWMSWKLLQQRQKEKVKRQFRKILVRLGL